MARDPVCGMFVDEENPAFTAVMDGKAYYFCVESPESVPGDAITPWAYRQVDLPDAKLYRNGRAGDGQLMFGLFYLDANLGEVGERPYPYGFGRLPTFWQHLEKTYRLLRP